MIFEVGFDEAGRGPLAGPVSAAAVILPSDFPFEILNDSKKLSEKKRESAEIIIKEKAANHKRHRPQGAKQNVTFCHHPLKKSGIIHTI